MMTFEQVLNAPRWPVPRLVTARELERIAHMTPAELAALEEELTRQWQEMTA